MSMMNHTLTCMQMTQDPTIIEATYAAMPDDLLQQFARSEAQYLPATSVEILKKELSKRGMPWQEEMITTLQKDEANNIQHHIVQLLLSDENTAIVVAKVEGLFIGKEIIRNDAAFILQQASVHLHKKFEETQRILIVGLAFFVCGFAVTFLPLLPGKHDLLVILAYCSMIFGGIRMLHGYFYKRKYKQGIDKLAKATNEMNRIPVYYLPPESNETMAMA